MGDDAGGRPAGGPGRRRKDPAGGPRKKVRRGTGETVKLTAVAPQSTNLRLTIVATRERVTKPELMLRLINQGLDRYDIEGAIRAAMAPDESAA